MKDLIKDIIQYNKLGKIVNQINGKDWKYKCEPCNGTGKDEGQLNDRKECYWCKGVGYKLVCIDLQDLLLALNKNKNFQIKFHNKKDFIIQIIYSMTDKFSVVKDVIINNYDLSKPLSNQKEEVYNKLIKILK